jgi:hypothetical protein
MGFGQGLWDRPRVGGGPGVGSPGPKKGPAGGRGPPPLGARGGHALRRDHFGHVQLRFHPYSCFHYVLLVLKSSWPCSCFCTLNLRCSQILMYFGLY